MKKSNFFSKNKKERQKQKLSPEERQMLVEMIEDGELNEEDLEGKKISRGEARRKRKDNAKSPLKSVLKDRGKKRSIPMVGFAGTLLLMIFCLLIYSVSYLIAPDHCLTAQIKVVKGGYELIYELEEAPLSIFPEDVSVGDEFYFTDRGLMVKTNKNSMLMRVVKIEGNSVLLEFCASEVPQFISTSQMKGLLNDKSTGKQFSTVKITGRVLLNRFSLIKIEV
jgi:hypothetical protein